MPKYKLIKYSTLVLPEDLGKLEAKLREYEVANGFSSKIELVPFNRFIEVFITVPSFAITALRATLYNLNKKK